MERVFSGVPGARRGDHDRGPTPAGASRMSPRSGALGDQARRRGARAARRLLLLLLVVLAGCKQEASTPEAAVRAFVKAVEEGNRTEAYRLLAPASQQQLQTKANLANAQAGRGQHYKPSDLLAVGQEPPHEELNSIRTLRVEGDQAQVEIATSRSQKREVLSLVRVEKAWRVLLPQAP